MPIDPDVAEAFGLEQAPLAEKVRAGTVDPDVAAAFAEEELEAAKDDELRLLFEASGKLDGDRHAGIIRLAEESGIAPDLIEQNFDGFRQAAAAAKWDPRAFRQRHPELAELVLQRPSLAPAVIGDDALKKLPEDLHAGAVVTRPQERSVVARGVEALGDWWKDSPAVRAVLAPVGAVFAGPFAGELAQAGAEAQHETAEKGAAGEPVVAVPKLREPKAAPMQTDPAAAAAGAAFRPGILATEWSYQRKGLERSRIGTQLMLRLARGEDTFDLEKRRVALEQEMGPAHYYKPNWLEQLGLDAAQLGASQVESLVGQAAGKGAGAAVGLAAGGVAAVAAKRPGLALKGARLGSQVGGWAAGAAVSFNLEAGGAFLEFRDLAGPDGQKVPTEWAMGGALAYGAIAAAIEVGANEALLKSLGPLGQWVSRGERKAFAQALLSDGRLRDLVARAGRDWARGAGAEASEEFSQQALQQITGYALKLKAGSTEAPDLAGGFADAADAGVKALSGMAFAAPGTLAFNVASQRIVRARMSDAQRQVAAVAAAAKDSRLAQASPASFAHVVERSTESEGAPVTHLYINPDALTELLGGTGLSLEQAAADLMGEEGPKRLAKAVYSGQKLEVPVEEYTERWAQRPIAEQLVAAGEVTTRSYYQTPAELAREEQDLKAREKELVEQYQRDNAAPASSPAEERFLAALQTQLLGSKKRLRADQAREQAAVVRASMHTLAHRLGVDVEQLFDSYALNVQKAAEGQQPAEQALQQGGFEPSSLAAVREKAFTPLVKEGKVLSKLATSATTGLLGKRGVEAMPADPALPMLAEISWESFKATNDRAGHTAGDDMLRTAAQAIQGLVPWAGQLGNAVVFPVRDQAHAVEVVQQLRGRLPKTGIRVSTAAAPRVAGDVRGTMDAVGAAHREIKAGLKGKARWPKRGERPTAYARNKVGWRKALKAFAGAKPVEGLQLPKEILEKLGAMTEEQQFQELYREASGLYTLEGWDAVREVAKKGTVVSADLRSLGAMNTTFGRKATDEIVGFFSDMVARKLAELGLQDLDVAHPHGDEYYAQGDDAASIERLFGALEGAARRVVFFAPVPGGVALQEGLSFAVGVGRTFEDADGKQLPAKKKEQDKAGGVIEPRVLSDAAAAARLAELARSGYTVVDLSGAAEQAVRRGVGEATARLEQGGEGGGGRGPRGWVDVAKAGSKRLFNVFLTTDADLSTFLHEAGHIQLEVLADLAARPDAPPALKADLATILKWMGVESFDQVQREHHEKFARGFERYLMEGRAPSVGLQQAFERFARWLLNVYKSIAALRVELNDEVRAVFDRLLATDEEIETARNESGLRPAFHSPAEAGMSAAEWAHYLDSQERATGHAKLAAQLHQVRERLREVRAELKKKAATFRSLAEQEYDALPATRAAELLRTGDLVGPDRVLVASGVGGLERADVVEVLGEDVAAALEKKLGRQIWHRGGSSLDELAGFFGYPTGQDLADALLSHPEKAVWVPRRMAELQLEAVEGLKELEAERDQLQERVQKGLHGDATAAWLLQETEAIRRKAGGDQPTPIEAIRAAAHEIAQGELIGYVWAGRALQAERAAANKAFLAVARGQYAQALVFYQQRLLNFFLHRELTAARQLRDQGLRMAQRLSKEAARERMGKASPVYRDVVDTVLEAVHLAEVRVRDQQPAGLSDALRELELDGISPNFDAEPVLSYLAQPRDWRSLSIGEFENLVNALKVLQEAVRRRLEVVVDGKAQALEEVVTHLEVEARANLPERPEAPSSAQLEGMTSKARGFFGGGIKPERLLKFLGGRKDFVDTWWFRAIFKPIAAAKAKKADLLKGVAAPVVEAWKTMPASMRRHLHDDVDGAELFPDHRKDLRIKPPSKRYELLVMALNAGNTSNLERLLEGRHISEEQLHDALAMLSKEEWDWIQAVWDSCESLWPASRDLEERVSGVAPPKIAAQPVQTRHGTYRGGYFPAVYDRRAPSHVAERQAAASVGALFDPGFVRPGTFHSHLKKRADHFSDCIALDPSAITAHLAQVCHDLAFREPVMSVGRILFEPRVQALLKERLGHEWSHILIDWLQGVAREKAADVVTHTTYQSNRLLWNARAFFIRHTMALRVDLFFGDMLNVLLPAVTRSGVSNFHLAQGVAHFAASPLQSWAEALEKSGELRSRQEGLERELRHQIEKMGAKHPLAQAVGAWWDDHAFVLLEAAERATAGPVFWGAYSQGLADAETKGLAGAAAEERAVTFADHVVREYFTSRSATDKAAWLRDKGVWGFLTVFQGFFNTVGQHYLGELHELYLASHRGDTRLERAWSVTKQLPGPVAFWLGLSLVIGPMAEFVSGRGPEPEDGDDEAERWSNWFLRKELLAPAYAVPFLGTTIEGALTGGRAPSERAAPGFSALYAAGKAVWQLGHASDGDPAKLAAAALRAASMAIGGPGAGPLRAAQYVLGKEGLQEARDPFDVASGLAFGEREGQGENPFRLLSELASGER